MEHEAKTPMEAAADLAGDPARGRRAVRLSDKGRDARLRLPDLLPERKVRPGGEVSRAALRTEGASAEAGGAVPVGAGAAGGEGETVDLLAAGLSEPVREAYHGRNSPFT